ncbi:pyridoxamine 5'-phosphate oxidase family protein [Streptomyces sp. NPDC020766]|uniref:pyridoxamine 5'-phosphate oxidase family protein n=1 Tax=Streptomyces sp. NPDC020766 TaxID=3155011 RepID=UPI0033D6C985
MFAGELPVFDPSGAPDTPAELFADWLLAAVAAGVREPHAMTLSTAGADGNPTARTLILKGLGPDGRQFASDGGSVKARNLAERPYAALTFYWSPLARQIRVRGPGTGTPCQGRQGATAHAAGVRTLRGRLGQAVAVALKGAAGVRP